MALETDIGSWLDERKAALVSNYNAMGLKASGGWEQELNATVEVTPQRIKAKIDGAHYTHYLVHGRKPNKNQSKLVGFALWAGNTFIKDWVEQKGIMANPIGVAYNIGKKGIEVPNRHNNGRLVTDAFPESEITALMRLVINHFQTSIKVQLNDK